MIVEKQTVWDDCVSCLWLTTGPTRRWCGCDSTKFAQDGPCASRLAMTEIEFTAVEAPNAVKQSFGYAADQKWGTIAPAAVPLLMEETTAWLKEHSPFTRWDCFVEVKENGDAFGIISMSFPSDADAILFQLRWFGA